MLSQAKSVIKNDISEQELFERVFKIKAIDIEIQYITSWRRCWNSYPDKHRLFTPVQLKENRKSIVQLDK